MLLYPRFDEIVCSGEHKEAIAHSLRLQEGEESINLGKIKVIECLDVAVYVVPFVDEVDPIHDFSLKLTS